MDEMSRPSLGLLFGYVTTLPIRTRLIVTFGLLYIVGDLLSTYYFLSQGYEELNPLANMLLICWPCMIGLKCGVFLIFIALQSKIHERYAIPFLWILILIMVLVILNNTLTPLLNK